MKNLSSLFLALSLAAATAVVTPALQAQDALPQPVAEASEATPVQSGSPAVEPAAPAPAQPAQPIDATANLDQVPPVTQQQQPAVQPMPRPPIRPRPGVVPTQQPPVANSMGAAAAAAAAVQTTAGVVDSIDMPQAPVADVLSLYESLTGYTLIRDPGLAQGGLPLTISIKSATPKADAIAIIENTMLMAGYAIVPEERIPNTVTILGPGTAPSGTGIFLFKDLEKLIAHDTGDRISRFFRPLEYLSPDDAMAVLNNVMQMSNMGKIAPAPSANALIITEKTPFIVRAAEILDLIDREPAQVVTRFIPLVRASAEKTVETLNQIFGTNEAASTPAQPRGPQQMRPQATIQLADGRVVPAPGATGGAMAYSGSSAQYEDRLLAGKTKFLADMRTNRILVVTRSENMKYINEVIGQLDAESHFEQPFIRPLHYLSVNDAFPVLTDMLVAPGDSAGAGANAANTQNRTGTTTTNQPANNRATTFGSGAMTNSGRVNNRPDRFGEVEQAPPLSVSLSNEIRIMGDTSGNTIIVYGPPDVKERARQIIDLLDRRPKQVIISAVIGQMRMGKGAEIGASYLIRTDRIFNGFESSLSAPMFKPLYSGMTGGSNTGGGSGGADIIPGISNVISPTTMAAMSGFAAYAAIGDSVDVLVRALESTTNFRTLARPSIYTTNNKKATILSGMRIPVPTSTNSYGGSNEGTYGSFQTNIQYQDVALKLEVIPLINSEGEVRLQISQTNDNLAGFDTIGNIESPRIATQEINTDVIVPSGATVILGGLITDEEADYVDGLPLLSSIPYIGPIIFGSKRKTKDKYELVVMIQPVIVDSDRDLTQYSAMEAGRYQITRDFDDAFTETALPVDSPYPSIERTEVAQQKASTPKPVKAEPVKEELKSSKPVKEPKAKATPKPKPTPKPKKESAPKPTPAPKKQR